MSENKLYFGNLVDIHEDDATVDLIKPVEDVGPNLFIFDEASLTVPVSQILELYPVFSLNMSHSARINRIWELENYETFKSLC